jgi:NitT/TauT family transport system permease protein
MKNVPLPLLGWIILIAVWELISVAGIINNHILPSPMMVKDAFIDMLKFDHLGENIFFSLKINLAGYVESIALALPVGFMLGIFGTTRKLFSQQVDSLRFVPITAMGGIFIALSGLTIWTKIHFLAFGIWVYLVPVIVQRISEVSEVHLQMMQTLGATRFQTFRYVQWMAVISKLSDDIRILVGISWTYIIVAELKNVQGGLGSLIFLAEKQSNIGKVYVVLAIIVTIGILQDLLARLLDWTLFRFKYA